MSRVASWFSLVALVVTIALVIPFLAPRNPGYVPLFVVAAAGAIAGLVLARRLRAVRWALVSSLLALVVDAILVVIFVVAIVGTPPAEVTLRGQGPDDITVTYSNQIEEVTLQWPSEGRAEFNTDGDWAEIVVAAPAEAVDQTVSCQIVWNDEVVVDETSSGSVTCRYDER